ncbi:MAG: PepSY-associated TM helix domain-containing protein [Xanthobacteraceae bacterium]
MKIWALKIHRWVALTFALPLVFVLGTGLVLSFEPWLVVRAITPGALTVSKLEALLSQHDADGKARSVVYRSYDGTLTISAGRGDGTVIDVASGQELAGPSTLANVLTTARRMHERLLINAGWLVVCSSITMLLLAVLGMLMGLPRFANTLSGWHKAFAWGVLPLIVLSPLTGLLLASNITFMNTPPVAAAARGAPLRLGEAVRIIGEQHDLSTLVWIRPQGGRLLARLVDAGEYRVYAVTRDGMTAMPRNWPRLWHEGNFAGAWSALLNLVASVAMIGLLVTGPLIWLRRRLRLRARRIQQVAPAV